MSAGSRKRALGNDCPPIDTDKLMGAFKEVERMLEAQVNFPLPPKDS